MPLPLLRAASGAIIIVSVLTMGYLAGYRQGARQGAMGECIPAPCITQHAPAELPAAVGGDLPDGSWFREWLRRRNPAENMLTKWTSYFPAYERHFARFRGRASLKVLVIGVSTAGDIDMWRDYFGHGFSYWGVDNNEECLKYRSVPGVMDIIIGDQGDARFWKSAAARLPDFDIIYDDGGHMMTHQIETFKALFALKLKPGGLWLTEDTHSSYWPSFGGGLTSQGESTARTFLQWIRRETLDGLQHQFFWGENPPTAEQLARVPPGPFQPLVEAVHFYNSMVFVDKAGQGGVAPSKRVGAGTDKLQAFKPIQPGKYVLGGVKRAFDKT